MAVPTPVTPPALYPTPDSNCTPRIFTIDDTCGCSLTRASIQAMTPAAIEAQGLKETGMDRILAQTKEARMVGVPQSSLMDLILSRHAGIKTINMGAQAGRSIIAPFFMVPQRHTVNSNYWDVVAGAADGGAGSGGVHPGSWNLTLENNKAPFSTKVTSLEKYFPVGTYVTVLWVDSNASNVGRTAQFKVTKVQNNDFGGVPGAIITGEPSYSASGWGAATADTKASYKPPKGTLIPLSNSVSNYESWCYNRPAENNLALLVFWLQTIRETHCYNDEYLKAINAPLTSEYFKNFRTLPLAQQKKRQAMQAEIAYYNTLFYGQAISEKQTVETYQQLPQVVDPANTSCTLEYKSNTLGWRTQLAMCGRVIDLMGNPLNLDTLRPLLYLLKRNREVDSGHIDRIDAFTDRFTKSNILTVMIDYYKKKYGITTQRFYKPGERLQFGVTNLFEYDLYEFPEEGLELAVFTHPYFDDHLAAFPSGHQARGRSLWLLDWSDLMVGLAGSASVSRQTNLADNLYNCIITANINHYQLTSRTIAAMIQDPNRHLLVENFSSACPVINAAGCTATVTVMAADMEEPEPEPIRMRITATGEDWEKEQKEAQKEAQKAAEKAEKEKAKELKDADKEREREADKAEKNEKGRHPHEK